MARLRLVEWSIPTLDSPLPVFHPYHKFAFIVILTLSLSPRRGGAARCSSQLSNLGRGVGLGADFRKTSLQFKSTYEYLFGLFGDMSPNQSPIIQNLSKI